MLGFRPNLSNPQPQHTNVSWRRRVDPPRSMAAMRQTPINPADDCGHTATERLGNDHDAGFYRCLSCGQVVVVQGGLVLAIPAVQPQAESSAPSPEGPRRGVDG